MVLIPADVLNDIFSRFILPEAKSNCSDPIRLCFAIEMGHWFYLDYIRPSNPAYYPDCPVETFAKSCFKHMPSLLGHNEANLVLKNWRDFKRRVPVYGAMLITPDRSRILLVEGDSTRGCWTFPRGKIEENEDPFDCAIREVKEETSFDITQLADRSYYIEKVCSDRRVRLYIVHDVPNTTVFFPKMRGEIANFRWFPIDELPGAQGYKKKAGDSFFMVHQFIREYFNKGYRTGKKRNNASECARTRGSSFNDGDFGATQYPGRKDSYNEPPDLHRNYNTTQGIRSRDPRSRDYFPSDPVPRGSVQMPAAPTMQMRSDNINTRQRTRGGRGRRGNPASRGFPGPPGQSSMLLSDFHLDIPALIEMLPPVSIYKQ